MINEKVFYMQVNDICPRMLKNIKISSRHLKFERCCRQVAANNQKSRSFFIKVECRHYNYTLFKCLFGHQNCFFLKKAFFACAKFMRIFQIRALYLQKNVILKSFSCDSNIYFKRFDKHFSHVAKTKQ